MRDQGGRLWPRAFVRFLLSASPSHARAITPILPPPHRSIRARRPPSVSALVRSTSSSATAHAHLKPSSHKHPARAMSAKGSLFSGLLSGAKRALGAKEVVG